MVERTPDGRHVVVNGRKWRASDPSIPDNLRAELVGELMDARRAVKDAGDQEAEDAARTRVDDAKNALGERGRPWWDERDTAAVEERSRRTISALLARRGDEASICPSDVARVVGGESWRDEMGLVREVARRLARDGELRVTSGSEVLDPEQTWPGPIRLRR